MAKEQQSGEGLSHSLTDLMTSIAVIFILLFLVFLQNKQEELASRERQTETNLERLFAKLDGEFSGNVKVEKDPDDPLTLLIVLRDNPEILSFTRGEWYVREKGKLFLQNFVPRLSDIVCSEEAKRMIDSLIIEGHTDSSGNDDRNTFLSAARATQVLIESRKVLAELEDGARSEGVEKCFLSFSQATGRGEQELILREADKTEDEDASRRVVIKIRVKSLEQRGAVGVRSELESVGG